MSTSSPVVESPPIEVVRMKGEDGVEYSVRAMPLTLERIREAWEGFSQFEVFSDDGPQDLAAFTRYVIETRGMWFEAIGDGKSVGLIYISNMVQSYNHDEMISAMIHAVVWDAKAAPRRVVMEEFFRRLFPLLKLHRLEGQIPAHHAGAIRTLKKLGFSEEGRKREAARYKGSWFDVIVLSLLESEVK